MKKKIVLIAATFILQKQVRVFVKEFNEVREMRKKNRTMRAQRNKVVQEVLVLLELAYEQTTSDKDKLTLETLMQEVIDAGKL